MAIARQRRRGTTAEHAAFTGLAGEVTIDTTKKTAVVHDGVTAGGIPLAKESHNHAGVYEPADATILKSAAIGVSVEAHDATILKSAAIGVSVQPYDADTPTVAASQAEMEAGTEAAVRSMSPLRVAQAIAALAGTHISPLLINGNFSENQRGATSVADDTYCADRFYVLTESGNVTVAQLTDLEAGCPWGYRLTQPDASAKRMGLAQIIESKNCRNLRSAVAALAARIKPSFATAVRYAILEHTGTADSVTSDVVNNWASATFTAGNFFIAGVNVLQCGSVTPGAATFGDIAAYGAVGASMNNLIVFVWTESQVAQNSTLDFSRFDLNAGAVALPRVIRPNELALAQRYLEYGTLYAGWWANTIAQDVGDDIAATYCYKAAKRAVPTVTVLVNTGGGTLTQRIGTVSEFAFSRAGTFQKTSINFTWKSEIEL